MPSNQDFQNKDFQDLFMACAEKRLKQAFSTYWLREDLKKFVVLRQMLDPSEKTGHISHDKAIMAVRGKVWERFLDDFATIAAEGGRGATLEDLVAEGVQKAVNRLVSHIRHAVRDKVYAGLRQAVQRQGETFIRTPDGRHFALREAPTPDVSTVKKEYANDVREAIKVLPPSRHQVMRANGSWDYDAVRQEAILFWRAYIDRHYDGMPHFVSIYALSAWLRLHHQELLYAERNLGNPQSLDAPAGGGEDDLMLEDILYDESMPLPDDACWEKDLKNLAVLCVDRLTPAQVTFCAMRGDDPPATLEQIAAELGYAGASGAKQLENKLARRLNDFCAEHEILDEASRKLFGQFVLQECKRRSAAPKAGTEGAQS